jgi:hypothetical protein
MVKTIAVMAPTKTVALLPAHHQANAATMNSNALTDNVFRNRSNVTRNLIAVTTQTKLDVSHLL